MAQPAAMDWAKGVSPNSSLYFLYLVQLTRLSRTIFQRLYNPSQILETWERIQEAVKQLHSDLEFLWIINITLETGSRRALRESTMTLSKILGLRGDKFCRRCFCSVCGYLK